MSAPSLPRDNPFRPTFGAAPLYWVGREVILRSFERALVGAAGTPGRSLVISGSRGIGKTVLLNELEDRARTQGWIVLRASGRSPIVEDFVETTIPAAIEVISPRPTTRVKQLGLGKVASIGFDTDDQAPYKHNLNTRLRELSGHLTGTGILISIDEAQDASLEDLTTIAVAYQDLIRDDFNVALVVAGLPQGIDKLLSLPGATFLRRAEKYLLGP
ncbi:ATP-binding protein [Corynebacterium sp. LK2514]